MISYFLAKSLEEAGFPKRKIKSFKGTKLLSDFETTLMDNLQKNLPITLEELIEACGDRFDKLERHVHYVSRTEITGKEGKDWTAYPVVRRGDAMKFGEGYSGITPENAVSNLWLKLNEKK